MIKKNILVIMSDPQMLRTVNCELRKHYDVVPTTTVKDAKRFLSAYSADLVLLDLDGAYEEENKMIRHIHANPEYSECPIVLLRKKPSTKNEKKFSEAEVLKIGASDVIRKPFSFETLHRSLTRLLRNAKKPKLASGDAHALELGHADEKQTLSALDRTTGLLNRSVFMARASAMLSRKECGALFLLDIDGLKQINDRFGQKAGDDLIRRFSVLLRGCFAEPAEIANLGGDDFAVFLPTPESHANLQAMAEEVLFRVKRLISAVYPEEKITMSIGIGVSPEHGKTYDNLFSAAEDALVFVKNHGKGFAFLDFDASKRKADGIEYHTETQKPQKVLLARRKNEENQCWVKMGEYRLIWANNLRMHEIHGLEVLSVMFTLKRKKSLSLTPDELEYMVVEVRRFFADLGIKAVFAWYSETQFLMMLYRPEDAGAVILYVISDLPTRLHELDLSVQYEMMSMTGYLAAEDGLEGEARER